MILHDYFSGTGGFHLGLEKAGFEFEEVCFSEIDKHAIANYKYNFPNAKYIGGIGSVLSSGARKPNIITFGSPCQDFSLAGLRKGLKGKRSSLIEQAVSAITYYKPDIFIWENVKGAFSSNTGSDFWAIIQAFANIGGYGLEWQLVNTSWLLPQNRERIYLIGHLTESFRNWRRVFPIREDEALCDKREQTQPDKIASTLNANDAKSWVGNFITENTSNWKCGYDVLEKYDKIYTKGHGFAKDSVSNFSPTIRNSSFQHNSSVNGIRRLTEIECERLQGFPDDWTKWGNYDDTIKEIPKTQRYKMCGNAVTAKMVELIGKQLKMNYE